MALGFLGFMSNFVPWGGARGESPREKVFGKQAPTWEKQDLESLNSVFDPLAGQKPQSETDGFVHFGEWLDVTSSNVRRIKYDPDLSQLFIEYLNGGFYQYEGVSLREAESIARAASTGKWVWDHLRLRGTVFGYRKPYTYVSGPSSYVPQWFRKPKTRAIHALVPPMGIKRDKILGKSVSRILMPKRGGKSR